MNKKLIGFIIFHLIFSFTLLFAQARTKDFSRGELLFRENNAKDAVQVLEYEILNGNVSENSYNFLGLAYYQLGEYEKSIDAFKRGIKAQPENTKLLAYNMGNSYYALKQYSVAVSSYSDSIKADPYFYEAVLNRANALLMSGQLVSSKEEYKDFLKKCPNDPQREKIELLIKALEGEIARREEDSRLEAEQNKAKWEAVEGLLSESKPENFLPDWEQVNTDNSSSAPKAKEDNSWITFSDDELDEMALLEEESKKAHEDWLAENQKREAEIAARVQQERERLHQQSVDDEMRIREQILEEMRKADEERRKKLLEDVANSLQEPDSTNHTSGAEDLIDYDLEGELD